MCIRDRGNWIGGHNPFLDHAGVNGIKTGYTRASGFNLVTNVQKDGRHIIAVVMGASSSSQRNSNMASILRKTPSHASTGQRTYAYLSRDLHMDAIMIASAPERSLRPALRPERSLIAQALPVPKPGLLRENELLFIANSKVLAEMQAEFAAEQEARQTASREPGTGSGDLRTTNAFVSSKSSAADDEGADEQLKVLVDEGL